MDKIYEVKKENWPESLKEIPEPPIKLYARGKLPNTDSIYLAVVGSRKYSNYGKEVCQKLIAGLSGYPIVIVSGLAIGIDSIAHQSALDVGLTTVAFPGSGLNRSVLYPKNNLSLALKIIKSGGCIISEFEPDFVATTYSFPQRNRLMAGISKAVLIIEAEMKSGSLITARLALDYNKDVMAVPGPVFSKNSTGVNWLIREGAIPVTTSGDVLEALGFNNQNNLSNRYQTCQPEEKAILDLLIEPIDRDELIILSGLETGEANALLSIMEVRGLIKESNGQILKI
jgi:DNA processing protein